MMRLAAFTLLLLMVLDLGADFVNGENGDFLEPLPTTTSSSHSTLAETESTGKNTPLDSNHECFCCCSHLEQEETARIHVVLGNTKGPVPIAMQLLDPDPAQIVHPPQQFS